MSPRFEPGSKVRVKSGVPHPDYPDIPLGGWSGVINESTQLDNEVDYEIEWDQRTLDGIHPIYRQRCERDDVEWEVLWLAEADLEPDVGRPIALEPPTAIRTPPLSENDPEDRIRKVFGLTHDDPLPEVSTDSIRTYHAHLTKHLKFPFPARIWSLDDLGDFSRKRSVVTVIGLLDPTPDQLNLGYRLLCSCRYREQEHSLPLDAIEINKKNANFQQVSDYTYWVQNWPCGEAFGNDLESIDGAPSPSIRPILKAFLLAGLCSGIVGAALGAAFKTLPWAEGVALGGGVPLALIGAFALAWFGSIFGAVNRLRFGRALGGAFGLLLGGLLGVFTGLATLAFPWSLLGLVAGIYGGPYLLLRRRGLIASVLGAHLGTCGGIFVSAFRHNRDLAVSGASTGAMIGVAVLAGLVVLIIALDLATFWANVKQAKSPGPGMPIRRS